MRAVWPQGVWDYFGRQSQMAYTTQQLVDIYTNANLGKTPDLATAALIEGYAAGTTNANYTDPQALALTLNLLDKTTAVAVATRQFFVGAAPSAAGLAYIVNSTANANDLNDANGALAKFSQENRFINLSVSLATGSGEGAASFAAKYGPGISYQQTVAAAYDIIIGNNVAAAAGVNVADAVAYLSRAENITFLTNYVRGTGISTAAEIELAVKAALIGQILNVGVTYNLGAYANATTALLTDLSDGTLSTDTAAGVNILTAYPAAGATGTTYTLVPGADTLVGTGANDTFNALTIKADGSGSNTFTTFDSIDGGAGVDTLNIYTDDTGVDPYNMTLPATVTVKNVEIVNILNAGGAAALADASKYQGVQQLWQVNAAADVTNLATGVTAGFRGIDANVKATTTSTAVSASIALDNYTEANTITVDGNANSSLSTVNLSGTVVDGADAGSAVGPVNLTVEIGKEVTTANINTAVATALTIDDSASAAATKVSTVNLAGSTGAVTYVAATTVKTVSGGTGADTITIQTVTKADVAATAADETVTATVTSGAGNDTVNVNVTGDGLVVVDTGAGNDTVDIVGRGTAKLNINLGDGSDTFTVSGAGVSVNATDVIDAGGGIDTLALKLVGSANVGAFRNFEVFDVAGMGANLDLDILNTNNTVTEITGSAATTADITLTNVGAGVNFRATGDLGTTNTIALTQKTAGALTFTLDADEAAGTADTAIDTAGVKVAATNATSVTTVFDTAYLASIAGETTAGDNVSTINLTTAAATAVNVVSGGALSNNVLVVNDGATAANDKLATITITGDRALTLTATGTTKLATVDASAQTGGLTASLAEVANNGTIKLGSGVDHITITNASTNVSAGTAGVESIQGFEKALAIAVSSTASAGKTAAIADADTVVITGGAVANANAGVTTGTIDKGVLTFTGAGPATLDAAVVIANNAAETAGEAVVFQYLNDTYVFVQAGGVLDDTVVKLTGITGVTNFAASTTADHFFIV